jgi:hypothetical protein
MRKMDFPQERTLRGRTSQREGLQEEGLPKGKDFRGMDFPQERVSGGRTSGGGPWHDL